MKNLLSKIILPSFVIFNLSLVICLSGCGDLETGVSTLTVSPTSVTIGINQSRVFTAVAQDSNGQIVSASPTWSVSGGIGSISSSGLFIAGASAGSGSVTATYSGKTATANITITATGWVMGRVTDNAGSLVPSLKVYLENTDYNDFTDSDGDYEISNVPAGVYQVWTLETSAYRAASHEATVASGETTTVDFTIYYFVDPPDLNPPELEL